MSAPSLASAEVWACFPGSTGPGSGGKCLEDKVWVWFCVETRKDVKQTPSGAQEVPGLQKAVPSSSSTGTSWTNCSHQRRDDCLAVQSWMSNLQSLPARYMTATAMISGSHCRDSMVHRLPGTQTVWLPSSPSLTGYEENASQMNGCNFIAPAQRNFTSENQPGI